MTADEPRIVADYTDEQIDFAVGTKLAAMGFVLLEVVPVNRPHLAVVVGHRDFELFVVWTWNVQSTRLSSGYFTRNPETVAHAVAEKVKLYQ